MSTTSPATWPTDARIDAARVRGAKRVRFIAPSRERLDRSVLQRPPLAHWREFAPLIDGEDWPDFDAINATRGVSARSVAQAPIRFVAQTRELLADGLHYEQRIAQCGEIATRERNWHDLLNALVWLRYPALKSALNARQVAEIARVGPKRRTRAQCALTHFDEAGVIVRVRDPALIALWDAHDWQGLFGRERAAWSDGRVAVDVFGHALLEHALRPGQLLVGKALVLTGAHDLAFAGDAPARDAASARLAAAIRRGELLGDPQELRPLPLSGIPGWHARGDDPEFLRTAPCFRPLRAGRTYPAPLAVVS
jgi:hypothetical protein